MRGFFDLLQSSVMQSRRRMYQAPVIFAKLTEQHHELLQAILAGSQKRARAAAIAQSCMRRYHAQSPVRRRNPSAVCPITTPTLCENRINDHFSCNRLSRGGQMQTAALSVSLPGRRRLCRIYPEAQRGRPGAGGAPAKSTAQYVGTEPGDAAVRADACHAGGPGAGRVMRHVCSARRGAGGQGRREHGDSLYAVNRVGRHHRGGFIGYHKADVVPALCAQGPGLYA